MLIHSDGCDHFNRNNFIDVEHGGYDGASLTFVLRQIVEVLEERDSKWILGLIIYNILIVYHLCSWMTSTNSVGLKAYANTIYFNVFALLVCLISIWVERNGPTNRNFCKGPQRTTILGRWGIRNISNPVCPLYEKTFSSRYSRHVKYSGNEKFTNHKWQRDDTRNGGTRMENPGKNEIAKYSKSSIESHGLEKYEVFALLIFSSFSLITGSLVSLEVIGRLSNQPNVNTGRLGLGALLGFLAHLGTIIGYPDAGLNHVVCKALPCPTLRGCNPILGGNMISALILIGTHLVIDFWEIHVTDTAAALAVLGLTAMSMLPLAFYTLNFILQKLPQHMSEQLDKCIREALIIDGVLEFRNERFWTKSFGKIAGTLQVRVRKNANGNDVLENVMRRLSRIVSTLTIQEFRETRENFVDRPIAYYVNEILSSGHENIDDKSGRKKICHSHRGIDERVGIMRIEDLIGSERRVETLQSGNGTNFDIGKKVDEKTRTLTIYKNDNVSVEDRLWRGDPMAKNPLLCGTKIQFQEFDHFFVTPKNYDSRKIIEHAG